MTFDRRSVRIPSQGTPNRTLRRLLPLLSLLLVVPTGTARAQHDCFPYEPTDAGETIEATWSAPLENDHYQFTVPADPGGGYVIARVASAAPSQPKMLIVPPSGMGVVTQVGTDTNGPSPHVLEVAFEVYEDTTFDVSIIEDVNSPLEDHPVAYEWSWSFYSRVDCYEHNNSTGDVPSVSTARTIPLDQLLEAFSLAGHLTFAIPSDSAHNYDWYDFTLDSPTDVWIATVAIPTDQRIRVRLFSSAGGVLADVVPPTGEAGTLGPIALQAGTYYLDLHPESRGNEDVTLSEGESIPDHFDRPYSFIVSTTEIPACGFASIFCDGFESGGSVEWSSTVPPLEP